MLALKWMGKLQKLSLKMAKMLKNENIISIRYRLRKRNLLPPRQIAFNKAVRNKKLLQNDALSQQALTKQKKS